MIKILEKTKKKPTGKKDKKERNDSLDNLALFNGEMIKLFNFFSVDDPKPLKGIDFKTVLIKKKFIKGKGDSDQNN